MQVVDSEGYLKVKLVGGPVGPFVPYTGATSNVDLGEYEIKAGQVEFDQTPTGTAGVATMRWNDQDGTADLGLKGGNVTLQIGQEQVTRVVNKTGVNLLEANYQAVRVDGAQGNRLKVALAQADNDANSADTLGLVTETINDNQEGFVTTSGLVRNIDTTGTLQGETWADGNVLYLSGTTAGRVTNVKPAAPIHTVIMGYVVRAHATQGQIYVKVDNGYELDELHNVSITTPLNNQVLQYESATSLWKNKTISTGITIGSTAIASGVVGRVLFEGAGNVVQESSSLFWDSTNNRLGIGTSSPAFGLDVVGTARVSGILSTPSGLDLAGWYLYASGTSNATLFGGSSWVFDTVAGGGYRFRTAGNTDRLRIESTGNVLIGTTTDAGFRLDVNGTARVQGNTLITQRLAVAKTTAANNTLEVQNPDAGAIPNLGVNESSAIWFGSTYGLMIGKISNGNTWMQSTRVDGSATAYNILLQPRGGNVLINTTTDAGFRLDVNGTARVSGALTLGTGTAVASSISYGSTYGLTLYGNTGSNSDLLLTDRNGNLRFRIVNGGNILQTATTINDIIIGGTAFAAKSIYTSAQYGLVLAGSAGSSFNFSLIESTGINGLYIDSAGRAKIGAYNSTYNNSAILEAVSTTQGFLPPRMTTTQKNAIASPAAGLMVYDTTLNVISYYNGSMWI